MSKKYKNVLKIWRCPEFKIKILNLREFNFPPHKIGGKKYKPHNFWCQLSLSGQR